MASTPLLVKPTLDEVNLLAAKIGLPPMQAEAFFLYYESNGWRVGRNPMKCWKSALSGWKLRWQERGSNRNVIVMQKEFDRVNARMKAISDSYSDHQDWKSKDRDEYKRLKSRKTELMINLGVMV